MRPVASGPRLPTGITTPDRRRLPKDIDQRRSVFNNRQLKKGRTAHQSTPPPTFVFLRVHPSPHPNFPQGPQNGQTQRVPPYPPKQEPQTLNTRIDAERLTTSICSLRNAAEVRRYCASVHVPSGREYMGTVTYSVRRKLTARTIRPLRLTMRAPPELTTIRICISSLSSTQTLGPENPLLPMRGILTNCLSSTPSQM